MSRPRIAICAPYLYSESGRFAVQVAQLVLAAGMNPLLYSPTVPQRLGHPRFDRQVHFISRISHRHGAKETVWGKIDAAIHLAPDPVYTSLFVRRGVAWKQQFLYVPPAQAQVWINTQLGSEIGAQLQTVSGCPRTGEQLRLAGFRSAWTPFTGAIPLSPPITRTVHEAKVGIFTQDLFRDRRTWEALLGLGDLRAKEGFAGKVSILSARGTVPRGKYHPLLVRAMAAVGEENLEIFLRPDYFSLQDWLARQHVVCFTQKHFTSGVDPIRALSAGAFVLLPDDSIGQALLAEATERPYAGFTISAPTREWFATAFSLLLEQAQTRSSGWTPDQEDGVAYWYRWLRKTVSV